MPNWGISIKKRKQRKNNSIYQDCKVCSANLPSCNRAEKDKRKNRRVNQGWKLNGKGENKVETKRSWNKELCIQVRCLWQKKKRYLGTLVTHIVHVIVKGAGACWSQDHIHEPSTHGNDHWKQEEFKVLPRIFLVVGFFVSDPLLLDCHHELFHFVINARSRPHIRHRLKLLQEGRGRPCLKREKVCVSSWVYLCLYFSFLFLTSNIFQHFVFCIRFEKQCYIFFCYVSYLWYCLVLWPKEVLKSKAIPTLHNAAFLQISWCFRSWSLGMCRHPGPASWFISEA